MHQEHTKMIQPLHKDYWMNTGKLVIYSKLYRFFWNHNYHTGLINLFLLDFQLALIGCHKKTHLAVLSQRALTVDLFCPLQETQIKYFDNWQNSILKTGDENCPKKLAQQHSIIKPWSVPLRECTDTTADSINSFVCRLVYLLYLRGHPVLDPASFFLHSPSILLSL